MSDGGPLGLIRPALVKIGEFAGKRPYGPMTTYR